jgi:hypothetical protein
MKRKLLYKKKLKFLLYSFVVFMVIAYNVTIRRTIELNQECKKLKEQSEYITNAPMLISQLESKQRTFDRIIGMNINSGLEFQKVLLERLGEYCAANHIVLRDFPEVSRFVNDDYLLETHEVALEGNFSGLVRLVYNLEQKYRLGKIISLKYEAVKDLKTGELHLVARFFIQNIKKNENEI